MAEAASPSPRGSEKKLWKKITVGGLLAAAALTGCGTSSEAAPAPAATSSASAEAPTTPEKWALNKELLSEYLDSLPSREEQLEHYSIPQGLSNQELAELFVGFMSDRENYGIDPRLREIFAGITSPQDRQVMNDTIEDVKVSGNNGFSAGLFSKDIRDDGARQAEAFSFIKAMHSANKAALTEYTEDANNQTDEYIPAKYTVAGVGELNEGYDEMRTVVVFWDKTGGASNTKLSDKSYNLDNGEKADGRLIIRLIDNDTKGSAEVVGLFYTSNVVTAG